MFMCMLQFEYIKKKNLFYIKNTWENKFIYLYRE